MPTGYTHIIGDKPGVTFREFAMSCARAFGACVMQRDDPAAAPMNMDEQPSDYHVQAIATLEAERDALQGGEAAWRYGKLLADTEREYAEASERSRRLKRDYQAMLAQVEAWQPPSPDHAELKKFMGQQLRDSIGFDCHDGDCYTDEIRQLRSLGPRAWATKRLADIDGEIAYHRCEQQREVERVSGRNRWKRQLVDSL